jgi:hypothetical protein
LLAAYAIERLSGKLNVAATANEATRDSFLFMTFLRVEEPDRKTCRSISKNV